MKSRKKTKFKAKKASGKKLVSRKPAARDPPLSARETARVRESTQNIKEGKYRDFSSVDQMWEYAESEVTPASA